jgi:hypothetical protein
VPLQRPQGAPASSSIAGEGEGEEESMGRHRVFGRMGPSLAFTQAMVGHKWFESHPSADSQTQAPAREPDTSKRARGVPLAELWLQKCNHLPHHKLDLGMHSQLHLLPDTVCVNSRGPIILGTSCACRRGQEKSSGAGKRRDGIREAGAGHAEPQRG